MADLPAPEVQAPGVYHHKLGEAVVTAINDGMFEGATALLTGIPANEAEGLLTGSFRPVPPRLSVNAYLISMGGRRILVDTGCGTSFGPQMGGMARNLAAMGVAPDTIGTVLLTHGHPDHVGGLTDPEGKAAFPNAELVVSAKELAFWHDDAIMASVPEDSKGYFVGARAAFAAYAGRTRTVTDGEAAPGIAAIPEYGHTPGHTGYLISSGSTSLLIWGDIVHIPGVQFARPEAGMVFDVDGGGAVATRARIFDMAAADKLLVAGMHLDFPCFGHVERRGAGYAHVPVVWSPWM
ncbi:MAG: MBL fold metallo-hydrolase [Proteobacteria bacterium]|nr:MBL fold metallo-hydrolase [Pseudomonadota bacterium]